MKPLLLAVCALLAAGCTSSSVKTHKTENNHFHERPIDPPVAGEILAREPLFVGYARNEYVVHLGATPKQLDLLSRKYRSWKVLFLHTAKTGGVTVGLMFADLDGFELRSFTPNVSKTELFPFQIIGAMPGGKEEVILEVHNHKR